MSYTVSVRELRNHTAEVVRRVEAGEVATLTANGRPVADIVTRRRRPASVPASVAFARIRRRQADPGLHDDLRRLTEEDAGDASAVERVERRYGTA
jgi:prevent-host-death family protein